MSEDRNEAESEDGRRVIRTTFLLVSVKRAWLVYIQSVFRATRAE